MLKKIIKIDTSVEDFTPIKVMKWAQWASKHLGDRVNWSEIVKDTVAAATEVVTSQELQLSLVKNCVLKHDWAHNLMAGRLYSAYIHKKTFPNGMPTVKEQFENMVRLGMMIDMGYTDDEYTQMQEIIDHKRDCTYAYFQVEHIYKKYGLQNRVAKEIYETPQFTFMRMAARINIGRKDRMLNLPITYAKLASNSINAPTPNYLNLGTPHDGLASCCLYTADDSIPSLNAGDTIAYMMTANSAGIGGFINTRSVGDPVRKGAIIHQGKVAYYKAVAGDVTANIQAGRGGACTQYYSAYDPEAITIAMLQNEMSPDNKRNRDIHFAVCTNKWLAKKVAAKEKVFSFNVYTAPDLMKSFFSGDIEHFEELYLKYEADETFKKVYTPAVDLITTFYNQHSEVGTHYEFKIDEANRHTPFLDPIYSSNLCVAPETPVLTKEYGYKPIVEMDGKQVHVWNGDEWSKVLIMQTSDASELYTVSFYGNPDIYATYYHKWYVKIHNVVNNTTQTVIKRTFELQPGDELIDFNLPNKESYDSYDAYLESLSYVGKPKYNGTSMSFKEGSGMIHTRNKVIIDDVVFTGRVDKTYCFTEPKKHMGVFAGVLTGQCLEITEPTAAYESSFDLYSETDPGYIKFKYKLLDDNINSVKVPYTSKVKIQGQPDKQAGFLKVNDIIRNIDHHDNDPFVAGLLNGSTVVEIEKVKVSPEVAMCSLGGINVAQDYTDDEYEENCYQSLVMIDECIHSAYYPLAHIGYTSKNRMNAAVGLIGVATYMAKRNLKYSSKKGKEELHRLAERHAYFMIKASLRISKERGVAPWMHKTKWPQGWLPIDTYKKTVDQIVKVPLQYDWESLRKEIIGNGGIGHSALIAHMPTESSSKSAGVPNSVLPVRDLSLKKKDQNLTVDWVAVDSDLIGDQYERAFDIPMKDIIECYAIIQKFTDMTISADIYRDRVKNPNLYQSDLVDLFLLTTKYGVKSLYYANSKTSDSNKDDVKKGCASGACTL